MNSYFKFPQLYTLFLIIFLKSLRIMNDNLGAA